MWKIGLILLLYLTYLKYPTFTLIVIGLVLFKYILNRFNTKSKSLSKAIRNNTNALQNIHQQLATMTELVNRSFNQEKKDSTEISMEVDLDGFNKGDLLSPLLDTE